MTSIIRNFNDEITRTVFTPTKGATVPSWGGCYYAKVGKVVQLHLAVSGLTNGVANTVFTLPSGYRPQGTLHTTGSAGTTTTYCYVDVNGNNGSVTVVPNGATSCGADITFIAMN